MVNLMSKVPWSRSESEPTDDIKIEEAGSILFAGIFGHGDVAADAASLTCGDAATSVLPPCTLLHCSGAGPPFDVSAFIRYVVANLGPLRIRNCCSILMPEKDKAGGQIFGTICFKCYRSRLYIVLTTEDYPVHLATEVVDVLGNVYVALDLKNQSSQDDVEGEKNKFNIRKMFDRMKMGKAKDTATKEEKDLSEKVENQASEDKQKKVTKEAEENKKTEILDDVNPIASNVNEAGKGLSQGKGDMAEKVKMPAIKFREWHEGLFQKMSHRASEAQSDPCRENKSNKMEGDNNLLKGAQNDHNNTEALKEYPVHHNDNAGAEEKICSNNREYPAAIPAKKWMEGLFKRKEEKEGGNLSEGEGHLFDTDAYVKSNKMEGDADVEELCSNNREYPAAIPAKKWIEGLFKRKEEKEGGNLIEGEDHFFDIDAYVEAVFAEFGTFSEGKRAFDCLIKSNEMRSSMVENIMLIINHTYEKDLVATSELNLEIEPKLKPETISETSTETGSEVLSETNVDLETKLKTAAKEDRDALKKSESETKMEATVEVEFETKPEPEIDSKLETETILETSLGTGSEVISETSAEPEAMVETEAKEEIGKEHPKAEPKEEKEATAEVMIEIVSSPEVKQRIESTTNPAPITPGTNPSSQKIKCNKSTPRQADLIKSLLNDSRKFKKITRTIVNEKGELVAKIGGVAGVASIAIFAVPALIFAGPEVAVLSVVAGEVIETSVLAGLCGMFYTMAAKGMEDGWFWRQDFVSV